MFSSALDINPKQETVGALFIALCFVCINFAVATRTPTVNPDEPQHCDPAANLYYGKGFTSTVWGQPRTEFCGCNDPLYQGMQFCFFKMVGFSLFTARALNTLMAAAGGMLIWAAVRRTNLIQKPFRRLLCLALVLSGSVSTLTFRTIRYDTTMFFVSSLVFFACSLSAAWPRYVLVFLFSLFLAAAGLPMLPYWSALIVLNLLIYRWTNIRLLAFIFAGLVLGAAGLLFFERLGGGLHAFLEIALPSTALSKQASLLIKVTGTPIDPDNLLTCFFGNPVSFLSPKDMFDYSAFILFVIFCILALRSWLGADPQTRRFILHAIVLTLAIPPFMHMVGHYRSYYRWMTYIPLCIVVPRMIEVQQSIGVGVWLRRTIGLGVCFSIFLGVPFRTLAAVPGWTQRSVAPIDRVAAQIVRRSDIVVCDFKEYFAVRPRVDLLYAYGITATGAFNRTKDLPTNNITLLCLTQKGFEAVTNMIGGNWAQVPLRDVPGADALRRTRYAVDFYRRSN